MIGQLVACLTIGVGLFQTETSHHPAQAAAPARELLDTAIARMGGADVLRGIERVRFDLVTQWLRLTFDRFPFSDQPTYELHTELRDYTLPAWRNHRSFGGASGWTTITDIVTDSVAIRQSSGKPGGVAAPGIAAAGSWTPLNIAYVDERRELFAVAPERLLLAARAAGNLRRLSDSVIAGSAQARAFATVGPLAMTILVQRSTGFLTAVQFRAAQPNDFGLAPWGAMDVTVWYGAWRPQANGMVYPMQWDVYRLGRPYKRTTVLAATWNPPGAPDSFAISDSLRAAFTRRSMRPMHDIPVDTSARISEGRFLSLGVPGTPVAVKLGGGWIFLEAGEAPLVMVRAAAWLAKADSGSPIHGAIVTTAGSTVGALAWFSERRLPVHLAPGAAPLAKAALEGYGVRAGVDSPEPTGRWLRFGFDSLRVEPIDFPDAPGSLLVYAPSLHWIYSATAFNTASRLLLLSRAREHGWAVQRIGSLRDLAGPIP